MGFAIGINPSTPSAILTDGKGFGPGDVIEDGSGNSWVFVKATSAIVQYDAVTYDETFTTTVAPVSTSNDARGDKVGVAASAFASGDYGFVQVYGPCTLNVLASATANGRLNTTAQGGYLDDDGTTGAFQVEGIYLTTARTASSGSAPALLNWPITGVVLP